MVPMDYRITLQFFNRQITADICIPMYGNFGTRFQFVTYSLELFYVKQSLLYVIFLYFFVYIFFEKQELIFCRKLLIYSLTTRSKHLISSPSNLKFSVIPPFLENICIFEMPRNAFKLSIYVAV